SGIRKTAELIQEISASGAEQAEGIGQVNRAVQQLDQIIQKNAAAAEQMTLTAQEFSSQAEYLLRSAAFFRVPEDIRKRFPKETENSRNTDSADREAENTQ
ncbi:MAG: methyl-accepting chemotaxis protein, partial [Desulfococcaceae bacterium]|nr:methyl-accepting chemotaxis protein [Desulfococcaceae bacterium]